MDYVLDACALIAYFNEEDGSDKIASLFEEAEEGRVTVMIHGINLFEVHYDLLRSDGDNVATAALATLNDSSIKIIDTVSEAIRAEAAHFKNTYRISVADAFALATAKLNNAILVTSDHHEFDPIEAASELSFLWIR